MKKQIFYLPLRDDFTKYGDNSYKSPITRLTDSMWADTVIDIRNLIIYKTIQNGH